MIPVRSIRRRRDVERVAPVGRTLRAQAPHGGIDHHLAQGRAGGFLAALEALVQRAAHDAGVCGLGVPELAGLVNLVAAQPEVGCGSNRVGTFNAIAGAIVRAEDVAPRLCGVVFVGQPTFGARLDLERMGLRAMRGRDEIVMGALCALQPCGAFRDIVGKSRHVARLENFGRGLCTREHAGGAVDQAGQILRVRGDRREDGHCPSPWASRSIFNVPVLTVRAGSKPWRIASGQAT